MTAVDNSDDEPDIEVTVSGTAAGGNNVADPSAVTLTIRDDEGPPLVTLILSSTSISENGGVSTVTATLNRASSAATTVTVSASGSGFTLSSARTLTVAAGSTASAGDGDGDGGGRHDGFAGQDGDGLGFGVQLPGGRGGNPPP